MKQFRFFILLAAAAVLGAVACEPAQVPELSLTDSELTVPAEGLQKTLEFSTNESWSAVSSASWVSVDPSSGSAGNVRITVTVAANDTFEERSATVTVTAANLTATITVKQDYERVFELQGDTTVELDGKAQTFSVKVNSNLTYQVNIQDAWIAQNISKAAPVVDELKFEVQANNDVTSRESKITITPSEGQPVTVTVKQNAAEGIMKVTSVTYISNRQGTYDDASYSVRNHAQYVVEAETSKGSVTLVLTSSRPEKPLEALPAGSYKTDMSDSYAESTITVGSANHKFYTTLVEGGAEKDIIEAEVNVVKDNGNYSIEANLAEATGTVAKFTSVGTLPAIQDASKGLLVNTVSYAGDYATHFATGAEKFQFHFCPSCEVGGEHYVYSLGFSVFAKKGNGKSIPTGTFNLCDADAKIDSYYANGICDYPEGSYITSSWGDGSADMTADGSKDVYIKSGTFSITANQDGTYKFDFDFALTISDATASADVNYKKTFDKVAVPEITDDASEIYEDVDVELTYASISAQYSGYYVGNTYEALTGAKASTFLLGWSYLNGNYSIQLALSSVKDAEYVINNSPRTNMSTNPISPGTYTFQKYGVDGKDCIANCTSTTYRRVANNYTGTVAYVDGGSVKIESDKVTFDLYATTSDGSKRLHYTGTLASTFYYVQDKRESQSHLKAAAWLSGFLYKSDHETFDGIYNVNW